MENKIFFSNLKDEVMFLASQSDEVIVISGYVGPITIEELAQKCPKTTVVYGMYGRDGISSYLHKALCLLSASHNDLKILYSTSGTHTKCYIFFKEKKIKHILVGSANLSEHGLSSPENTELLTYLSDDNFTLVRYYIQSILSNSIPCDSDAVVSLATVLPKARTKRVLLPLNPLSVSMPLYYIDSSTKEKQTQRASGLNWGNSNNHHKKTGAMEACIPVSSKHIDNYPLLFPPKQLSRTSSDGKSTRVNDPIEIIWDDGYVMKAIFSGNGPVRNERVYPKQLTSNDGGGVELGGYIRSRMKLDERHVIEYSDLQKYGRDDITLTYIQEGIYAADFSV